MRELVLGVFHGGGVAFRFVGLTSPFGHNLYLHSFGVTDIEGLLSVELTILLRSEDKGSVRGLGVEVGDWATVTQLKGLSCGSGGGVDAGRWQSIWLGCVAVVPHLF